MPACVDSRPEFMRRFGLDFPEETEEELEREREQAEQHRQDDPELSCPCGLRQHDKYGSWRR